MQLVRVMAYNQVSFDSKSWVTWVYILGVKQSVSLLVP